MGVTAGTRDRLITFQKFGLGEDEYGEEEEKFLDAGKAWAQVFYGRGDERRQAAAEQGRQTATFKVPANTLTRLINVKDRIVFEGDWDIEGIAHPDRASVEFTAARPA